MVARHLTWCTQHSNYGLDRNERQECTRSRIGRSVSWVVIKFEGRKIMTSEYSDKFENNTETSSPANSLRRRALVIGTPILLGTLLFIHPDGSGGLDALLPVRDAWLYLHIAMLPLLGLLGVSLYVLLNEYSGTVATIGRIGVAIYMTFYVAFEAIAGVATGLLAHEAQTLPKAQQAGVAAAIDSLVGPSVVIGFIGTLGAIIAVAALGLLLRRSGAPLVPVILLGGAPLATLFHGGLPLDAIALSMFLVAVTWIELKWRPTNKGSGT